MYLLILIYIIILSPMDCGGSAAQARAPLRQNALRTSHPKCSFVLPPLPGHSAIPWPARILQGPS